jgi:hypothetical protein
MCRVKRVRRLMTSSHASVYWAASLAQTGHCANRRRLHQQRCSLCQSEHSVCGFARCHVLVGCATRPLLEKQIVDILRMAFAYS